MAGGVHCCRKLSGSFRSGFSSGGLVSPPLFYPLRFVYEGIVLHDQGKVPGLRRTAMAMKYQKGTVYPRGQKVKMWYGKYTVYLRNDEGKEVGKRRNVPLCPKAGTPKWKAEQMLHALILKDTGTPAKTSPGVVPDETVTFRWFVEERYLPMREGTWSPAYR